MPLQAGLPSLNIENGRVDGWEVTYSRIQKNVTNTVHRLSVPFKRCTERQRLNVSNGNIRSATRKTASVLNGSPSLFETKCCARTLTRVRAAAYIPSRADDRLHPIEWKTSVRRFRYSVNGIFVSVINFERARTNLVPGNGAKRNGTDKRKRKNENGSGNGYVQKLKLKRTNGER